MDIIKRFEDFIQEADDLAAAFATTGEDDNSYDADRLVQEAKVALNHLNTGVVTEPLATAWLDDAQKRLDDIG